MILKEKKLIQLLESGKWLFDDSTCELYFIVPFWKRLKTGIKKFYLIKEGVRIDLIVYSDEIYYITNWVNRQYLEHLYINITKKIKEFENKKSNKLKIKLNRLLDL